MRVSWDDAPFGYEPADGLYTTNGIEFVQVRCHEKYDNIFWFMRSMSTQYSLLKISKDNELFYKIKDDFGNGPQKNWRRASNWLSSDGIPVVEILRRIRFTYAIDEIFEEQVLGGISG